MNTNLSGKIAVVTGASGGIGKEIARGLARQGATVVLAVRDVERGDKVARELHAETKANLFVMPLDVADVASVRRFAAGFVGRFPKLHFLVNNAGAWFTDRRTGPSGEELTFATNVLGPHLLVRLLAPTMIQSRPARIVNVVSALAKDYDATDLQFERRPYDGFKAYSQSKQALRMLTWGQAARLEAQGVTVNAVAPGFVKTELNRHARGFVPLVIGVFSRVIGVTPEKGAETPLWALGAPELEGVTGKYFDGLKEKDGKFHDPAAIRDLEERCEALLAAGPRLASPPVTASAAA